MEMTKKNILVVGNGGLAREIRFLIDRINGKEPQWNFLGYIDTVSGTDVLGDDQYVIDFGEEISVVLAIADPQIRRRIYESYRQYPHIQFPTLIDPSCIFADSVRWGEGVVVCANTSITVDVEIGDFCIINPGCTIGHDVHMEKFCVVKPGSNLSGNVNLRSGCDIGTGVQIIQGVEIGENTIVGAGAVVVRDLPENCTAVGVPAKVIKHH